VTPVAGTDAVLCNIGAAPPGGWRVYAQQASPGPLSYADWLDGVRAGRTYVTSLPLLPLFRVNGCGPGGVLDVAGDSLTATVELKTQCVLGLRRVSIASNLGDLWSCVLSNGPPRYELDTTVTLNVPTPAWLGLRAEGPTQNPILAWSWWAQHAIGHTNVVRVRRAGAFVRDPLACGRMLDQVDRLDTLLQTLTCRTRELERWQYDSLSARVEWARGFYGSVFHVAPSGFPVRVLTNGDGRATGLAWSPSTDPEAGDRVSYRVTYALDSTFSAPTVSLLRDTAVACCPAPADTRCWWRVEAVDRGGNVAPASPAGGSVISGFDMTVGVPGAAVRRLAARAWPNPSRSAVRIQGLGGDVEVFDIAGRRVARPGHGVAAVPGGAEWDGSGADGPAPSGLYFARDRGSGRVVRIVRIR